MLIGDGDTVDEIEIDGYVHYVKEDRFGENGDGKYGGVKIFVEDVTEVCGYNIDGVEIPLTE
jgi:hypothetical protein